MRGRGFEPRYPLRKWISHKWTAKSSREAHHSNNLSPSHLATLPSPHHKNRFFTIFKNLSMKNQSTYKKVRGIEQSEIPLD